LAPASIKISACLSAENSLFPNQAADRRIHPHSLSGKEILKPRHPINRGYAKPARQANGGNIIRE
jgi:hypothetical protein